MRTVRIDNKCAANELMTHLIALGHREIAFITSPTGHDDSSERLAGYRHGHAQANQEMGITAVDLMLDAVEPLPPAWRELVHPHSLVPRDSTVAP